jgi:AcrR family transcriptional regulator
MTIGRDRGVRYNRGMRTHGWSGDPPADDDEAVRRILEATRRCVERSGPRIALADVARELGVTRQTVYRYFPTTDALVNATAVAAAAPFLTGLSAHLDPFGDDPAAVAVEAVAYALDRVPEDPFLGLLLRAGAIPQAGRSVTSQESLALARSVVDHFPVDWERRRVDEQVHDELAEHLLRTIQSFLIDPGDPPRRGSAIRAYLERWIAPAVRDRAGASPA